MRLLLPCWMETLIVVMFRGGFVVCNFQDDNHREGSNLKRLPQPD
jgi:hypothetical protein